MTSRIRAGVGAHPRSRGADRLLVGQSGRNAGSSPLARGGLRRGRIQVGVRRLIPARAGRTRPRQCGGGLPAGSSPLARGGHRRRGPDTDRRGSSPLARGGRLKHPNPPLLVVRLIPARAGRTLGSGGVAAGGRGSSPLARGGPITCACRPATVVPGAHPRSRGADTSCFQARPRIAGSSPLARGGRTPTGPRSGGAWGSSPLARGGLAEWLGKVAEEQGSSPLARGGHLGRGHADLLEGLIPARAGRTCPGQRRAFSRWAHPRSRGADEALGSAKLYGSGSSPLARGGQRHPSAATTTRGLIPARAGRTVVSWMSRPTVRAHPRSRGADLQPTVQFIRNGGSSPLARGGHTHHLQRPVS